MKINLMLLLMTALALPVSLVRAEQTTSEKVEVKAKDAKRAVKKGYHRTKEKMCMKSDAECARRKAKHRSEEAGDKVKDGLNEFGDKID